MNRFLRSVIIVLGVVLVVTGVIAFVWRAPAAVKPKEMILVSTSFFPIADAVSHVGGQYVTVRNMLPPGAEPHDFEPAPRDLVDLGKADLFLYNGGHFEPWIDKWVAGTFERPRYTLPIVDEIDRRNIPLIEKMGIVDPHIWVSPAMFMHEVGVVRDVLVDIDPTHAKTYQENATQYLAVLRDLDEHYRTELMNCEKNDIIVSHNAFSYLARDYGFSMTSIAGLSPDEEPSPKTLAEIAKTAQEKGLSFIFFETTVNPKLSQTIAREIHGEVLSLNPVESLTQSGVQSGEDYVSTMFMNLNNLRKALVCH